MSKDGDGDRNGGKRQKPEASYTVGYGNPPKDSQFKPGKSGNPRGRPKGSKEPRISAVSRDSLAKMFLRLARRKIKVTDSGSEVEMEAVEAISRSLQVKALKGDVRAQSKFLDMVSKIEAARRLEREKAFETALTYKDNMIAEIEERKAAGEKDFSDIVPHPDHIHIDPWAGTAYLVGPLTPEEKKEWEWYKKLKEEIETLLPEMEAEAEAEEDPQMKQMMLEDNERARRVVRHATRLWSFRRSLVPNENGELEATLSEAETQKPRRRKTG